MNPSDEPFLPASHPAKRLKLKRVVDAIAIHMPLNVWFELILRLHCSLVELIHMKRVCMAFATYKPLAKLIKTKIEAAFFNIDQMYWNRMASNGKSKVIHLYYTRRHVGKFMYVRRPTSYGLDTTMGVFSCKALILAEFERVRSHINSCKMTVYEHAVYFSYGKNCYDIFVGINSEIEQCMKTK